MFIQQGAPLPVLFRLQAMLTNLVRPAVDAGNDRERAPEVPGLDPYLKYDIGEIDYRPRASALDSYERRLWLHHYHPH